MTTTDTTTETDTTTQAPEDTTQGTTEPSKSANAESAKYRRQLREASEERDQLAAALESTRKTMIEGIAGKHLGKPAAMWLTDVKVADLLDDKGNVDAEKVTAAAKEAQSTLGLERAYGVPIVPGQGSTPTHRPRHTPEFADAFAPRVE